MNTILISDAGYIAQASNIAFENYRSLRDRYPWMPEKKVEDFIPRIEWMTREGYVYGLEDESAIQAFIGWFKIDNFRNLGPGALTPDWCSGIAGTRSGQDVSRLISPLVRRLMSDLKEASIPIHAIGISSANDSLLEEFSLLGYGRIVLDAAQSADELLSALSSQATPMLGKASIRVRSANLSDARALSALDASLARHIGSPPVLMPDTSGDTVSEWEEWLADPETVTFVAESEMGSVGESAEKLVGFIKADPPHFDVSWFVHDLATLGICGLYVEPFARGKNVASALLYALVTEAVLREYSLISVDCETHNPEARSFWLSRFKPIAWSFERRF